MERPLADAATEHLWRTLFALVVELSIRSGLVTENDLAPAGPMPLHTNEVPRAEVEEELQEQGEESADENDPIVEFAPEPDAETEPRASQEGQLSAEFPHSADPQTKETAPGDVATNNPAASSLAVVPAQIAGNLEDAVPMQDQYPVEYDPFDRPVEEVVMQLFDDDPPPLRRLNGRSQEISRSHLG